ncbi:DNA-3-methyladenine glycosylase I [Chitinibacteraceae bacterium HSL-7]
MVAVVEMDDGVVRCRWCSATPDYVAYHDHEWGIPVTDDTRLFEKICLEGFQSGLSWLTILNKRDAFRAAFCGFDFYRVAQFGVEDVERLLLDAGIVRHRGKIEATVNNARRAVEMVEEFGSLAAFFWRFEPELASAAEVRSQVPESVALSKALKKRGWSFVGPTTVYAFMQAMGMVNDHARECVQYARVDALRRDFVRPN